MSQEGRFFKGKDRRKSRRSPEMFVVTYRVISPMDVNMQMSDREINAAGIDIGEGGIGVESSRPIPAGTKLSLKFTLQNDLAAPASGNSRSFELEAETRYCQPTLEKSYHAGLIFKNASGADRAFIAAYIKDQALKQYGT